MKNKAKVSKLPKFDFLFTQIRYRYKPIKNIFYSLHMCFTNKCILPGNGRLHVGKRKKKVFIK